MRLHVLLAGASLAVCLGATCAVARAGQSGQAEDHFLPYPTHVDRRHGQNHVYPDRGAILRDLPRGAAAVDYASITYRFEGGVWYQRVGPAYMVVAPPIGFVVPQLPAFATRFYSGGKTYLYANDVFYRSRPGRGGYEVVNDPGDAPARPVPLPVANPEPESGQASAAPVSRGATLTRMQAHVQAKKPPALPRPLAVAPASVSFSLANPTRVVIHPRNGQSAEQEARDRYDCYRFAVMRSGFDPLALNGGGSSADAARHRVDYSRAQAGCLEGRGYAVM